MRAASRPPRAEGSPSESQGAAPGRVAESTSCSPGAAGQEEEIAGPGGLLGQLTKRLVERAMEVELTDHLGYEPHQEPPGGAGQTPERVDAEDAAD